MKVTISGHQSNVGEAFREHVKKHVEDAVGKYFADSHHAHVSFTRESQNHLVHISVHVGRDIDADGSASALTASAAFNLACEHVEKQLRRSKRKLRAHH